MNKSLVSIVAATLLFSGAAAAGELLPETDDAINGQYIVVLKEQTLVSSLAGLVGDIASTYGIDVDHVYGSALNGFAGRASHVVAELIAADPRVAYVEPDQTVRAIATTQNNATWGIDRVDETDLPTDGRYIYDGNGNGVHVYVVDTGINHDHADFTGRIGDGFNAAPAGSGGAAGGGLLGGLLGGGGGLLGGLFGGGGGNDAPEEPPTTDCNGHGSHVSGTAVGTRYGVAKQATVHPVRIFGCDGSGPVSDVIAGVDWVAENHIEPAVANMSLGGGNSRAMDDAVRAGVAQGVTFVVAAGNANADACGGSPNRVDEAITVGATDNQDRRSSFSNWGQCVDIMAPGTAITSAWFDGDNATATINGTSMASPHVAGAAALLLSEDPGMTPAAVMDGLNDAASTGKLIELRGSPNRLLYTRDAPGIDQ